MKFSLLIVAATVAGCGNVIVDPSPGTTSTGTSSSSTGAPSSSSSSSSSSTSSSSSSSSTSSTSSCGSLPGPAHTVLFGGTTLASGQQTPAFDDTWVWDGSQWTSQPVSGPSPRAGHSMATRGGKVVLFGGDAQPQTNTIDDFLGDTWEWDGGAWSQVATGGPPARAFSAMAEQNGKVVLFGGQDTNTFLLGDTWEWDGSTWVEKSVPGPPPRYFPAMASLNGNVILEGGMGDNNLVYSDTWQWDGTSWTELQMSGPEEYQHAMAPVGCALVLSGWYAYITSGGATTDNETRIWNGAGWGTFSGPEPQRRQFPSMAATPAGALLFGGFDNTSPTGGARADTWLWNGTAWAQLMVGGPPGRFQTAMASY